MPFLLAKILGIPAVPIQTIINKFTSTNIVVGHHFNLCNIQQCLTSINTHPNRKQLFTALYQSNTFPKVFRMLAVLPEDSALKTSIADLLLDSTLGKAYTRDVFTNFGRSITNPKEMVFQKKCMEDLLKSYHIVNKADNFSITIKSLYGIALMAISQNTTLSKEKTETVSDLCTLLKDQKLYDDDLFKRSEKETNLKNMWHEYQNKPSYERFLSLITCSTEAKMPPPIKTCHRLIGDWMALKLSFDINDQHKVHTFFYKALQHYGKAERISPPQPDSDIPRTPIPIKKTDLEKLRESFYIARAYAYGQSNPDIKQHQKTKSGYELHYSYSCRLQFSTLPNLMNALENLSNTSNWTVLREDRIKQNLCAILDDYFPKSDLSPLKVVKPNTRLTFRETTGIKQRASLKFSTFSPRKLVSKHQNAINRRSPLFTQFVDQYTSPTRDAIHKASTNLAKKDRASITEDFIRDQAILEHLISAMTRIQEDPKCPPKIKEIKFDQDFDCVSELLEDIEPTDPAFTLLTMFKKLHHDFQLQKEEIKRLHQTQEDTTDEFRTLTKRVDSIETNVFELQKAHANLRTTLKKSLSDLKRNRSHEIVKLQNLIEENRTKLQEALKSLSKDQSITPEEMLLQLEANFKISELTADDLPEDFRYSDLYKKTYEAFFILVQSKLISSFVILGNEFKLKEKGRTKAINIALGFLPTEYGGEQIGAIAKSLNKTVSEGKKAKQSQQAASAVGSLYSLPALAKQLTERIFKSPQFQEAFQETVSYRSAKPFKVAKKILRKLKKSMGLDSAIQTILANPNYTIPPSSLLPNNSCFARTRNRSSSPVERMVNMTEIAQDYSVEEFHKFSEMGTDAVSALMF